MKNNATNGLLKSFKANEESQQTELEEDSELAIIIAHRENQEEIEVDIDDL